MKVTFLARGWIDDASYRQARVSLLDGDKVMSCQILEASRRGDSVYLFVVGSDVEAGDISDVVTLRLEVDGLVAEAEVKN